MKLQNKIIIGVATITALAIITVFAQAFRLGKYAALVGESSGIQVYGVAIVVTVLLVVISANSLRIMIKTLDKHIETLNEYTSKLADGEANFTAKAPIEDEFVSVYESLQCVVDNDRECENIADAIAHGDLTVKCQAKSANDLMSRAFVELLANNNRVLSGIKESSYQLTTGAEQVASASQALAQGSTEQAAAIEEVTVSMKEIEDMTKANADDANKANDIVLNTKKAAELGNERMIQMKSAMGEINDSSEKISKIIKVIDDISFQTNILALNAAVEAARAGIHGKGFAVVAEQIRELAGKSADAAAETADMIDDSIRKVHNGTKLADETAKALNEIVADVQEVVDITGNIAKASTEQASAVAQIDQAINQVSMVVQNNSATSEECAAAAEELSGQSQSLRQMIGKYKLVSDRNDSSSASSYSYTKNDYSAPEIRLDDDPESVISLDGGYGKY